MYRLVSERALPHTAPMYRRLSAQLAKARREGRFPDLIDTVREIHAAPAWPGAAVSCAFDGSAPLGIQPYGMFLPGVNLVYGSDLLGPMHAHQLDEFTLRAQVQPPQTSSARPPRPLPACCA